MTSATSRNAGRAPVGGQGADRLAAALAASPESDYVRLVAAWLEHGETGGPAPRHTGQPVVDALVAAATAHRARLLSSRPPDWTRAAGRVLESFWHPGGDRFFAYSLAHAPAEFAVRGLIVEADSLVSV